MLEDFDGSLERLAKESDCLKPTLFYYIFIFVTNCMVHVGGL
jgi:hypothetical protein